MLPKSFDSFRRQSISTQHAWILNDRCHTSPHLKRELEETLWCSVLVIVVYDCKWGEGKKKDYHSCLWLQMWGRRNEKFILVIIVITSEGGEKLKGYHNFHSDCKCAGEEMKIYLSYWSERKWGGGKWKDHYSYHNVRKWGGEKWKDYNN